MCERNDIIASENFKPKFLSKTNVARNAQDTAIATNIQILQWQAVKNGRKLISVNPAYTTQTCSECGEIANPPNRAEGTRVSLPALRNGEGP